MRYPSPIKIDDKQWNWHTTYSRRKDLDRYSANLRMSSTNHRKIENERIKDEESPGRIRERKKILERI